MELTEKEKRQIFWALINKYPEYEKSRRQVKKFFSEENTKAKIVIINKEEKLAYKLIKKFADEIAQEIPEYKIPEE